MLSRSAVPIIDYKKNKMSTDRESAVPMLWQVSLFLGLRTVGFFLLLATPLRWRLSLPLLIVKVLTAIDP
jgi:hypothetical protein